MKKLLIVFISLLMLLSLSACSDKSDNDTNKGDSSTETIKIGMFGPYTGDYAEYGLAVLNGAKLAVEESGNAVEIVNIDTQGDPTAAVNAYNKLVDEGVVAFLGGVLSGESVAVGSASQSNGKLPIISASATAVDFSLTGKNVFRGCFTDPHQGVAMADYVFNEMGIKKVATIFEPTDYSQGLVDSFKAEFVRLGGELVAEQVYPSGTTDFSTYLTSISSLDVEGIYLPIYYSDVAMIAQQAANVGLNVPMFGNDGWGGVLAVISDASALEGGVFVNHTPIEDSAIDAFTKKYTDTFGVEPISFSYLGYDCMKLLIQAVGEADSLDVETLTKTMQNIDFTGIAGSIKFDENGDAIKSYNFVKIENGVYADAK